MIVQTPRGSFPLTVRGRRGPPATRPDPVVIVGEDGKSRLHCPVDGAPLIPRRYGLYGWRFYGCSRWPDCTYTLVARRARLVKRVVRSFLRQQASSADSPRSRSLTLTEGLPLLASPTATVVPGPRRLA